jgi:serine/threonine protein phosphatase PrpC
MCICIKTAKGLKRRINEDSYFVIDNKAETDYDIVRRGKMFVIADGMGGQRGGGLASKMACEGMSDYYRRELIAREVMNPDMKLGFLEKIIHTIHEKIRRYGEENKKYAHMGTTLSVLVLVNHLALIAHVGDSRIYRLRGDILELLTEDHTMAQLSVEMGYLKPKHVSKSRLRHILTQAIGETLDEIQTKKEEIKAGDIFLLCTDGLYDILSDDEIRKIMHDEGADPSACERLVEAAHKKGGQDDATVILVQV